MVFSDYHLFPFIMIALKRIKQGVVLDCNLSLFPSVQFVVQDPFHSDPQQCAVSGGSGDWMDLLCDLVSVFLSTSLGKLEEKKVVLVSCALFSFGWFPPLYYFYLNPTIICYMLVI